MTIIVTGAAMGIGRATTELLLDSGTPVVAVDRDLSPLGDQVDRPGLVGVEGDVTSSDTIERAVATAGSITGVVACAGISRPGPSASYPPEDWARILDINLSAVFFTLRAAAVAADAGASLIAISSISGLQGFAGRAAYSASKAGVDGLVRTLAVEFAPRLRVNAIAPGYIMTDLVRRNLADGVINEDGVLARTPMSRWGEPGDIARAARFLLSDDASWITGITLPVDGGWMAFGLGGDR